MRILMFTPGAVGFPSPSIKLAEGLAERGHKLSVVAGDINKLVVDGEYDVVWAEFERSVIQGYLSAASLNLPIYAHVEWVPEHRVTQTSDWGLGCISTREQIKNWDKLYKPLASLASKCDVCSYADEGFIRFAEEYIDRPIPNAFVRRAELPPDTPELLTSVSESEFAVTIVARIAPIKRVPQLINAIGIMNLPRRPKVYVIGDGEERMLAHDVANRYNLDIEFAGAVGGEEKWDFIARGRVLLNAWAGIPPGEALMVGRPTISYDSDYMRNHYGDTIHYVPNNDVQAMAHALEGIFMADDAEIDAFVGKSAEKLMSDQIGLNTFEQQLDTIEGILLGLVDEKT